MIKPALVLLSLLSLASAQGAAGMISGELIDAHGLPVKNATVYACHGDDACSEPASTDNTGRFVLSGIPAGKYDLKVKKAQYYPTIAGRIRVRSGQNTNKHFKVTLAACCDDPEYLPDGSYIDTRSTTVKTTQRTNEVDSVPVERGLGGILSLP